MLTLAYVVAVIYDNYYHTCESAQHKHGHYWNKCIVFITIAFSASDLWHQYLCIISSSVYVFS